MCPQGYKMARVSGVSAVCSTFRPSGMIKQMCNKKLGPEGNDHNQSYLSSPVGNYNLCNKCVASYFSLRKYIESNWDEEVNAFEDMGLKKGIIDNFPREEDFSKPLPIQAKCIPSIIQGYNVIVQGDQTTGKTYSGIIAALQKVDTESNETQVLVLAPNKILAQRMAQQLG